MDPEPLVILLNGRAHSLAPGSTVLDLLGSLGLAGIPVLVEHNARALFPREFPEVRLSEDDRVEIIRIVAGG